MGPCVTCPSVRRLAIAVFLSFLPVVAIAAQGADDVTLVVQQNGREIGRETFTLRAARARGVAGTTIISSARYPAASPALNLATTIERTPDFALAKFQMDVDSGGAGTVILAAGSGARLIVRTVAKGSEAGRELPGGPDVVLLDDGVFSLYAQVVDLATPAGRSLTAIFPRTGRRASFTARREQLADGNIRVTLGGGLPGTLLADANGRLRSLELSGTQTVVTRLGQDR
jgi:hypothetical protein